VTDEVSSRFRLVVPDRHRFQLERSREAGNGSSVTTASFRHSQVHCLEDRRAVREPGWATPDSGAPGRHRVTVLHIEDDPLWAKVTAHTISRWPEFRLVGTVLTGSDGIARCRELAPEIVVLNLRLPDIDGFEVLSTIRGLIPPPRVLLLTCRNDDVVLHHTTSPSISGLLPKSADYKTELRTALLAIARGGRYVSAAVREQAREFRSRPEAFFKLLTNSEIKVLQLIASGFCDAEIAAWLGTAEATAHSHRQRIMQKLEIHSSTELVLWALDKGFA